MSDQPDIDAWCRALADTLLPTGVSAGQPVRLNCDDEAMRTVAARMGLPRTAGAQALVDRLRAAGLVDRIAGIEPLARVRSGDPPSCLPGLALLVLAASRMTSDELGSMAAYYARLAQLLDVEQRPTWPQVGGVPELVERFDDLAAWMAGPEGGLRGLLDLPRDVHPRVVGVPISQALLRAGDRRHLSAFFDRAARLMDAGWDPVHQLARWSGRHQLSQPLQELLAEPALHPALAGALRAARSSWDGTTVDSAGRRLFVAELTLDPRGGRVVLSTIVPSLDDAVQARTPDGTAMTLSPTQAAEVPLELLARAADGPLYLAVGPERVRLLPGSTTIFEITPLGIQSVAVAAEDPVWVLTCDERLIASCSPSSRHPAPLPGGWALLCDVEPDALAAELRVERDEGEQDTPIGLRLAGGLRLADGVWLLDHPPLVHAGVSEPAPVTLDGRAHGYIEPGHALELAAIAHQPGVHELTVGAQTVTVELAVHGPRTSTGSLAFDTDARRVHAGASPIDPGRPGPWIVGAALEPAPPATASRALIVRYRATVDVIELDGSVRKLAPPPQAAWLAHVDLPQDGPWAIPDADRVVWVCVDIPQRKLVVAHRAVDVPLTDAVLDCAEWYADARPVVDRTDGRAAERWQRLLDALDAESA